jgi:hypothetical protein
MNNAEMTGSILRHLFQQPARAVLMAHGATEALTRYDLASIRAARVNLYRRLPGQIPAMEAA